VLKQGGHRYGDGQHGASGTLKVGPGSDQDYVRICRSDPDTGHASGAGPSARARAGAPQARAPANSWRSDTAASALSLLEPHSVPHDRSGRSFPVGRDGAPLGGARRPDFRSRTWPLGLIGEGEVWVDGKGGPAAISYCAANGHGRRSRHGEGGFGDSSTGPSMTSVGSAGALGAPMCCAPRTSRARSTVEAARGESKASLRASTPSTESRAEGGLGRGPDWGSFRAADRSLARELRQGAGIPIPRCGAQVLGASIECPAAPGDGVGTER